MELLFVYGTLKDPLIQRSVIGRKPSQSEDVLEGYKKSTITLGGNTYPIVSKHPGSFNHVEGIVMEVSEEELALIDKYETDAFKRAKATVQSGKEVWVYQR